MGSHFMNDDLAHHTAVLGSLAHPTKQDPYRYQHGFGNHHLTEAFPGALPRQGTNLPQKHPYGLYAEHLNGTSFISSRESASNVCVCLVCFLPTDTRTPCVHCQLSTCLSPMSLTWMREPAQVDVPSQTICRPPPTATMQDIIRGK